MDHRNLSTMLILTILGACQLFGKASSASLFGVNIDDPKNVIRQGVERIPQIIRQIPFLNKKSNPPMFNLQPFRDGSNGYIGSAFKPPIAKNTFIPSEPNSIYEVTTGKSQNNAYYNQAMDAVENQGSCNKNVNSEPVIPNDPARYITEQIDPIPDSEFNSEYTTTAATDDEWTTIDEPLNRIGAPPAVVASLLGKK